jgi:hypothetical protein
VDRTALLVPLVLAVEPYPIASPEPDNPRRDVDVVRNKDCLTRCEANDEPLMPAPGQVVGENARYYTLTFNLNIARPVFESVCDLSIVTGQTPAAPQ